MKKILAGLIVFCSTLYGLFLAYDFFSSYPADKVHWEEIEKTEGVNFEEWRQFSTLTPGATYRYYAGNPLFPVFDANYQLDKNGMRVEAPSSQDAKEHLILGGCSWVFGVALNAEDTLSSILRTKNSSLNAVNFGFPGGGLQNLLRAMDFIDLKKYAKEENGTFVYMVLPNHLHRWFPSPQYLSWASPKMVYYEVNDHKFYPKQLSESDEYKSFQAAKKAGLEHSYLKASGMREFSGKDFDIFVEAIKELRRKYSALYPKGKFLVLFYPDYIENASVDSLKEVLKKEKVEFMDVNPEFEKYKSAKKMDPTQFYVPVDGHPSRDFNEFVANKLSERVLKR